MALLAGISNGHRGEDVRPSQKEATFLQQNFQVLRHCNEMT
jgi:hypothetical protein